MGLFYLPAAVRWEKSHWKLGSALEQVALEWTRETKPSLWPAPWLFKPAMLERQEEGGGEGREKVNFERL